MTNTSARTRGAAREAGRSSELARQAEGLRGQVVRFLSEVRAA